jgi:non-specific serine/threonine protein kinase
MGACLADDMGLGKTAQLIGAMLADDANGPTLVVCPVSVLGNWEREINRFAPDLSVIVHHGAGRTREADDFVSTVEGSDVVLTTFSLLHRDIDTLGAVAWGRLALDEAQQIKNPGTKVARAARALRAPRRVALTGTPVENRLAELWSIMHFLNPGLLGTAASFQERFVRPIEIEHDPSTTERLGRITTPFILRRLKSDRSIITDLPDKIETVDRCPLTKEQVSLYQSVVDDLLERAEDSEGIQRQGLVLAGITKLKQVCNHPAHFLGDGSSMVGRSGKLRRSEELLDELLAAGERL